MPVIKVLCVFASKTPFSLFPTNYILTSYNFFLYNFRSLITDLLLFLLILEFFSVEGRSAIRFDFFNLEKKIKGNAIRASVETFFSGIGDEWAFLGGRHLVVVRSLLSLLFTSVDVPEIEKK